MRLIITENQLKEIAETQMLLESIFEAESLEDFKYQAKKLIRRFLLAGVSVAAIISIISNYCDKNNIDPKAKQEVLSSIQQENKTPIDKNWKLVNSNTFATVYNAVPAQCNADFGHTASMFRLNLYNVLSHRIIAMERTYMQELGLKYGDVVKIEGTNGYDGVWQIQDTMNKRFKGQHKIDILVPDNIKLGQWENVKLYVLKNPSLSNQFKSNFAPQVSAEENRRMVKQKRAEMKAKQDAKRKLAAKKNNMKKNTKK